MLRAHGSGAAWKLIGVDSFPAGFLLGARVQDVAIIGHAADGSIQLEAACACKGDRLEIVTGMEAPLVGAHLLTRTPLAANLPPIDLRLATTRGTNALLEKRGAAVALFVTEGFGDLLRIGDQTRPDLFALDIQKPEPLHEVVVEVPGRLSARGVELSPLAIDEIIGKAKTVLERGVEVACVALLHSDLNAEMEQNLAECLIQLGFRDVVTSSAVSARVHFGHRAETALVDAYLLPIMDAYLNHVQSGLGDAARLRVMTSAGGLVERGQFRAKDSLLSGPASGVVGAAGAGHQVGWTRVLAFDMGGTSTDVSRYDGEFLYQSEQQVGEASLQGTALRIETVAAGGGSICSMDRGVLKVGPESAGASPGPACYGAGGPLTLTDVQLLLGRMDPAQFAIPLDVSAAHLALEQFLESNALNVETPDVYLDGFLQIANERMANAIRVISLREGHDPAEYALVAFGGAGGLHACSLADLLGVDQVLVPRDAGILSARGLQLATLEGVDERQVLKRWKTIADLVPAWIEDHLRRAQQQLPEAVAISVQVVGDFRFVGQESVLSIPMEVGEDPSKAFRCEYQRIFGHEPSLEVELVTLRVRVKEAKDAQLYENFTNTSRETVNSGRINRASLQLSTCYEGPLLVGDGYSTVFVESGWELTVGDRGSIKLTRSADKHPRALVRPAEVELELFTQRFRHVVQVMGDQLKRTAISTNVKERLDYSCCLLDACGRLIANAPHVPVHLGAMGLCVRQVKQTISLEEGDVILTNHPAYGGSHLPDLTVVMPLFHDGVLMAFLANRAHHAEIGGIRPGSMPPAAHDLEEEGVIVSPSYLFRRGESQEDAVAALFTSGKHPTRAVEVNLADLRAQVAACRAGAELVGQLLTVHGPDKVCEQLGELYALAARCSGEVIAALPKSLPLAEEQLDDGTKIRVQVTREGERLQIDFTGTSGPRHPGNLNATPAIVRSAVMYVMRVLQSRDLPLNEGLLDSVDVVLPECFLSPDFGQEPTPAVVAGNVETSQRLVDTLLKAFEVAACSQGTMNNLIFGDDKVSYYETICGGAGAGPGFGGASAVHSHMTNTAITDPEVLERRYPVRLHRFAQRPGSGGVGQYPGGDGIVRELEFLEPVSVSLLTQHRKEGPYGCLGGGRGSPGAQRLIRAGVVTSLDSLASLEAQRGDRLIIETPGGGAWGD